MITEVYLESYLDEVAAQDGSHADAAAIVLAIANAGRDLACLLAAGTLAGPLAAPRDGAASGSGEVPRELDIRAHDLMVAALRAAPVACVLSEEAEAPLVLDPACWLAVAIDPLDGSSNIDTNAPVGTIFAILPADRQTPERAFLAPGHTQIAAGFMIYGVNTSLVLTLGRGTRLFTLDRVRGAFVSAAGPIALSGETSEYAVNASNQRHWDGPVQTYVAECVAGADGPRGRDFNTRWIASLVAEAYRIMIRGGIYLYPADRRPGYRAGRLRLVYEANPIALLIEQAGGAATDGRTRILDLVPDELHQRVPLVFGARMEVAEVARSYGRPEREPASPLFTARSLYRV